MTSQPKPVSQSQIRINIISSLSSDEHAIAMLEIAYPKVRQGWHLAVVRVPLDGTCELKHTLISQDDCPQAGPQGVWCLVTPDVVLHADDVTGIYQELIDAGVLRYTEQIYDKYAENQISL